MRRALFAAAVAATLLAGIVVVAARSHDGGRELNESSLPAGIAGRRAPDFELDDPRGGRFGTADVKGRPYVVTFLYTQCPDVCLLIGQELRAALADLGPDARRVDVLAISVDPPGDTPARVRRWLREQRMPGNFRYLLGTEYALARVWKAYYAGPQRADRRTSLHTASVWVVDAQGRIATKYSGGVPFEPEDLADDLRTLIEG